MVTIDDIKAAQQKLRGIAARTPLVRYYAPTENGPKGIFPPNSGFRMLRVP